MSARRRARPGPNVCDRGCLAPRSDRRRGVRRRAPRTGSPGCSGRVSSSGSGSCRSPRPPATGWASRPSSCWPVGMGGEAGAGAGAGAISLVLAARIVPGFFFGPLAGVLVDRWDRKKVMMACDLGRAVVIVSSALRGNLVGAGGGLAGARGADAAVVAGQGRQRPQAGPASRTWPAPIRSRWPPPTARSPSPRCCSPCWPRCRRGSASSTSPTRWLPTRWRWPSTSTPPPSWPRRCWCGACPSGGSPVAPIEDHGRPAVGSGPDPGRAARGVAVHLHQPDGAGGEHRFGHRAHRRRDADPPRRRLLRRRAPRRRGRLRPVHHRPRLRCGHRGRRRWRSSSAA